MSWEGRGWQTANIALRLHINVSLNRPPDRTWRRPPGRPRNNWLDQLRNPPVRLESSGDDIFERFTNAVRKYLLRNSTATSHTAVKRISLWGNLKDSYSQRMRTLVYTGRENSDAILTKVSLPVGVWTHLWHVVPWFSRLTEPNTQTRLMALFPGLPGWARARKVKSIWVLLKQETEWHCGSGFSWAICKSAPRSRQITMPAPHHSVF